MPSVPESLQTYVDLIKNGGDGYPCGVSVPQSDEFYGAVISLSSPKFKRVKNIRTVFLALNESGSGACRKVRFKPYFKVRAYMKDDGTVYFSLSHIFRTEAAKLVKLVLHEAAHLILSGLEGYNYLKALDREYTRRYGKDFYAAAISPIEYAAIKLSVEMLTQVSSRTDGAFKEAVDLQIERERSKLLDLRALDTEK